MPGFHQDHLFVFVPCSIGSICPRHTPRSCGGWLDTPTASAAPAPAASILHTSGTLYPSLPPTLSLLPPAVFRRSQHGARQPSQYRFTARTLSPSFFRPRPPFSFPPTPFLLSLLHLHTETHGDTQKHTHTLLFSSCSFLSSLLAFCSLLFGLSPLGVLFHGPFLPPFFSQSLHPSFLRLANSLFLLDIYMCVFVYVCA